MNGIEFLQYLREIQPDAVRMVLSASTDFDTAKRAINEAEVLRYITKPWQAAELKEVILLALARRDEASCVQRQLGQLTPAQLELRKLEADEPGITKVNWSADGSVIFY